MGWQELAACAGMDTEVFFPEEADWETASLDRRRGRVETERARVLKREVCGSCPVRAPCLKFADTWRAEGIWGGLSTQQRRDRRRGRKKSAAVSSAGAG